jgi:BirA family transcriptional regulator, biotin operon repressor / biotin---[acetyl-CoA-carboxylase] ligase
LLIGKKLGGILVEGSTRADGRTVAVVGAGVNCVHHPVLAEYPATDLAANGFAVSAEALFTALGARMAARLKEWNRGANFASIRTAWLARASGIGSAVEVRLANRTVNGVFETIDSAGALVLRHREGGQEIIAAGDVFPLKPG